MRGAALACSLLLGSGGPVACAAAPSTAPAPPAPQLTTPQAGPRPAVSVAATTPAAPTPAPSPPAAPAPNLPTLKGDESLPEPWRSGFRKWLGSVDRSP